jgi:hypothetical protein
MNINKKIWLASTSTQAQRARRAHKEKMKKAIHPTLLKALARIRLAIIRSGQWEAASLASTKCQRRQKQKQHQKPRNPLAYSGKKPSNKYAAKPKSKANMDNQRTMV